MGFTSTGRLYWGSHLVSSECTSFAIRAKGPGGAALLYITRKHQLHTLFFHELAGGYSSAGGVKPQAAGASRVWAPSKKREGELHTAMHAAMKPAESTSGVQGVSVRSVEQV